MRIRVKYIVENSGVEIGTEKNLQPNIAHELVKMGIVEIISGANKVKKNFVPAIDVTVTKTEIIVDSFKDLKKPELIEQCKLKGIELTGKETVKQLLALLS
jgi:hypothetical protein